MMHFDITADKLALTLAEISSKLSFLDKVTHYKALLICEEVITNQIRHADYEGVDMLIELDIYFNTKDEVEFVFKDNAKEFNPLNQSEPNLSDKLAERELGGLGIFMVKKYAKELSYIYENKLNILKVRL